MESERMFRIKLIFVFIMALPFGFLVFAGLLKMGGHRGDFEETCYRLMLPAAIVGAIGLAGVIYVYFVYRAELIIAQLPKAGLQLSIHEPNATETAATGQWKWYGAYTKHYAKYGMYTKELYLVLFCNEKMFCILRHKLGGMDEPLPDHVELNEGITAHVPVYYTRDYVKILGVIRSHPDTQHINFRS